MISGNLVEQLDNYSESNNIMLDKTTSSTKQKATIESQAGNVQHNKPGKYKLINQHTDTLAQWYSKLVQTNLNYTAIKHLVIHCESHMHKICNHILQTTSPHSITTRTVITLC